MQKLARNLFAVMFAFEVMVPFFEPEAARADDLYTAVETSKVGLKAKDLSPDGPLPAGRRWRIPVTLPYRMVMSGEEEAFLFCPSNPNAFFYAFGPASCPAPQLVARAKKSGDFHAAVEVISPIESANKILPFTIPSSSFSPAHRKAFFEGRRDYFASLIAKDLPGKAWWRHERAVSEEALRSGSSAEAPPAVPSAPNRDGDALVSTLELFTGGRAMSENLQLDRALFPSDAGTATKPIADIPALTTKSIDWKPYLEGKTTKADVLAALIPNDQHALFFPSVDALSGIVDSSGSFEDSYVQGMNLRGGLSDVAKKYQRQLCLSLSEVTKQVATLGVRSIAVTGSDPAFDMGTDVAVLLETTYPEAVQLFLAAQGELVKQQTPAAQAGSGEIGTVKYTFLTTPGRERSCYSAAIGKAVVVTNSKEQLARIAAVSAGSFPALLALDEYRYFRALYPNGASDEQMFFHVGDPAVRKWVGPRFRIADSRRARAAAYLEELHAKNLEAIVRGHASGDVKGAKELSPMLGKIGWADGIVHSSTFQTLRFLTPVIELPIEKVTNEEAAAYELFRTSYERRWRNFLDPVGLRLTKQGAKTSVEMTVMPLIIDSDYNLLRDLSKGVSIPSGGGDFHPEALLQFTVALAPLDSPALAPNVQIVSQVIPGVTNPLGWVGSWLSFYVDDDAFWQEPGLKADPQHYAEQNYQRLPLGISVEVKDSLKLAAFLTALRTTATSSAPGAVQWETLGDEGKQYVRVSESARGRNVKDLKAVFYAVTPGRLHFSLSERMIRAAIERNGKTGSDFDTPESAKQMHAYFAVRKKFWEAILPILGPELEEKRSAHVLRNVPILNVWKRMFPDMDPFEVHRRVWGMSLAPDSEETFFWNEKSATMESKDLGSPAHPKVSSTPFPLKGASLELAVGFENDGLRTSSSFRLDE